ncbi:MAG: DinB family protein [Anaerolineae bacterium]|nr:DinB family protein [Anaerolineae bacterium]
MDMVFLRQRQISQLENGITIARYIVDAAGTEAMRTYRDGGDGWTALEALCHLRDFEAVFIARTTVTLEQDNPPLPRPNPDELAIEKRYNEDDPQSVLDEWQHLRDEFLALLKSLGNDEATWARAGIHPINGPLPLNQILVMAAWHDTNHFEQMTRTLAEKRT